MGKVHYMISEAAKRVNLETHVLRHWEEELELEIGRTEMGHRYYTEDDLRLFNCIKELKEQGMLLKELKPFIPDMLKAREKVNHQKKQQVFEEVNITELQKILCENNQILKDAIIKEMGYLFQAQDLQDEERYKKLDCLIRQQQSYRKEYAKASPIRQLRRIFEG